MLNHEIDTENAKFEKWKNKPALKTEEEIQQAISRLIEFAYARDVIN